MGLVVTGLSQSDDIAALRQALTSAGLAIDRLQSIGPEESAQGVSRGTIAGADILTSDGSMGVPGITGGMHHGQTFFRNESLWDRLGDLEIPEGELDNYVEAVERGRTVVAYFAHDADADKVEELFRGANLTNVRRF